MSRSKIIINTINDVGTKYFEHCSFFELREWIQKEFNCSKYLANQSAKTIFSQIHGEVFYTRTMSPYLLKTKVDELLKIENIVFLKNLGSSEQIFVGVLKTKTEDFFEFIDGSRFPRDKYFKTIKFN